LTLAIEQSEYESRTATLAAHVQVAGLSGVVLFDPTYVLYYVGFAFVPTERPMAFVLSAGGEGGMLVPRLEREHAQANALVDHVADYPEYPGEQHPMEALRGLLEQMGIRERIGADQDGYPWILGYRGPSLSELTGVTPVKVSAFVEDQLAVKSDAELALIRESCKWANLAHTLLQRYTRPGLTEVEVSQRATSEATLAMLDAIGPIYRAQNPFFEGASAGYRGQIGRNAAIPHALTANLTFQAGDVLVTGASAPVWGYLSELERTMIIGEPSARQRELFEHMVALQDTAFDAIRPGALCSDVDRAVRTYYEEHQLWDSWKHHVGHCIGLRYHEGPFLDIGDDTEIKPGMVFTVEPGLYAAGLGGFRRSDTVSVTAVGLEFMTYYPRDLESLMLPA
jgi:Xaa-Pro aminopeptidase